MGWCVCGSLFVAGSVKILVFKIFSPIFEIDPFDRQIRTIHVSVTPHMPLSKLLDRW